MGILDDYNVDLEEFETSTFDVPDGVYDFAVGEVATQDGSQAHPDQPMIFIHYLLTSEDGKNYTKREYYNIPKDSDNPTDGEKVAMGRFKSRLLSLGFDEDEVNSVEPSDVEGITGTLQLVTTKGKNGGTYQNVRNLRVDEDGDEPAPVPAPKTTRRAAAVDKPVSKPAERPRRPKPEPEPMDAADDTADADEAAQLPEDKPAESDADIKARIEARRAARRAAAGGR